MIAALTVCTLLAAEPATPMRTRVMLGTQVVGLLGAGAASVVIGSFGIEENFRVYGRPDPVVFASSVALSMAVNMAMGLLLLPELTRLTNDGGGTVDVGAVRQDAWHVTRWIAAAGLVFAGIMVAGAVMERDEFGRGQAVMAIGAAGSAAAVLTFDVATLLSVRSGAREHRR